jgi:hypothetical protein
MRVLIEVKQFSSQDKLSIEFIALKGWEYKYAW